MVFVYLAGFDYAGLDSTCFCDLVYYFFSTLGYYFFASCLPCYYFLTYCFADPAGFPPSGSISNNGFPTSRLSPAFTWNLSNLPAWGLLISTVTLSVSTLATVSSCSTQSPYSKISNMFYFLQTQ